MKTYWKARSVDYPPFTIFDIVGSEGYEPTADELADPLIIDDSKMLELVDGYYPRKIADGKLKAWTTAEKKANKKAVQAEQAGQELEQLKYEQSLNFCLTVKVGAYDILVGPLAMARIQTHNLMQQAGSDPDPLYLVSTQGYNVLISDELYPELLKNLKAAIDKKLER